MPGAARERPWCRRSLTDNKIDGPIPTEFGQLKNLTGLRVPPASPTPGAARERPWCRRSLIDNKITGTFPSDLCDVQSCDANSGNDLVAPCGTTGCCNLNDGSPGLQDPDTCSSSGGGDACSGLVADTVAQRDLTCKYVPNKKKCKKAGCKWDKKKEKCKKSRA